MDWSQDVRLEHMTDWVPWCLFASFV